MGATYYYTHVTATDGPLYKTVEGTYQAYLFTVYQDKKSHGQGPPTNHRGIALLEHAAADKESEELKNKGGLVELWPVVEAAIEELNMPTMDIEGVATITGHCKILQCTSNRKQNYRSAYHKVLHATGK